MRILIPDDYQGAVSGLDCLDLLSGHDVTIAGDLRHDPDAATHLARAEALVLIRERTQVDAAFLARTPHLQVISQTGKLSPNVDQAACSAAGVALLEGVGSPVAPAELTWALIMASRRNLVAAANDLKAGLWQRGLGQSLAGQTLGIWGYGKIGRRIAAYGRAFDMKVGIWGSEGSRAAAVADGHAAFASRQDFFATADVLSLHLRLVEATRGLVGPDDLARMKPTALFVNTSRAGLVAPGALEAALEQGRPGYAALDVFDGEPLYAPLPAFIDHPRLLATPHLGYVEKASYELYFTKAFENLRRFAEGQMEGVVNRDRLALPR